MSLVKFQCCICGDNIDRDSPVDPCGLILYTNIDIDDGKEPDQLFFCRNECFFKSIDSEVFMRLNPEDLR